MDPSSRQREVRKVLVHPFSRFGTHLCLFSSRVHSSSPFSLLAADTSQDATRQFTKNQSNFETPGRPI